MHELTSSRNHGARAPLTMYRVFNSPNGATYTSLTEPTHASGTVQHEGINWTMVQETGVTHTVGVRNVRFNNIYLQKPRPVALSIHFDTGAYSRSYYPNAELPVQCKRCAGPVVSA